MQIVRIIIFGLILISMIPAQDTKSESGASTRLTVEEQIQYLQVQGLEILSTSKEQAVQLTFKAIHIADSINNKKLLGDALYTHGFVYYRSDKADSSIYYIEQSLKLRQETRDSVGIGQCLNRLGNLAWRRGDQLVSKGYHEQALEYLKTQTDYKETGQVLNNLANIYSSWNVFDEALKYYMQALDNFRKADFEEGIAWLNFSLTMFYKKLGNYESALESVSKSLEIYSKLAAINNDSTGIMLCYGQLGDINLQLKKYETGLEYHRAALKLRRKSGVPLAIADGLTGVGQALYLLGRYSEAISHIKQSMAIEANMLSKGARATNLKYLGFINHEIGNNKLALHYLEEGLMRAETEKSYITKKDILKKIAEIYSDQGRYGKAFTYQKEYIAKTDSMFNSEVSNRVASMQLVYEMKEKVHENELLAQNNRIQELELEKSHYIRNLLFFIVLLFISVIILVIYLYYKKAQANRLLQSKNEEIEKSRIRLEQEIEERRKIQIDREKLIGELTDSLKKIKTLSGLIPICANCKNIRNDQGYYMQVEEYIMSHSDAVFSHGICPDCAKKLYPESHLKNDAGDTGQ